MPRSRSTAPAPDGPRRAATGRALFGLFVASGAAALIYQVLWARELARLFGSTAQGAALTIAVFFTGLALGGWWWGTRAARTRRASLAVFGWLEVGVALTALGFLGLLDVLVAVEPTLVAWLGDGPVADLVLRVGVAVTVLLPPSVLMGGTLPVLGQHLVEHRGRLSTTGSALYAVNTAGSALGALAAGFVLPGLIGYLGTYLLAVGLDLTVGVASLLLARGLPHRATATRPRAPRAVPATATAAPSPAGPPPPGAAVGPAADVAVPRRTVPVGGALVWTLAAASGVLTLAVEVVWTRLFSQVLQNSAYTYGLVLASFLLALALGAAVANRLAASRLDPATVLPGLLLAAAVLTAAAPWLFHTATGGLGAVGGQAAFAGYVATVAGLAAVTLLVPVTVLGALLPYLLRVLEQHDRPPGELLGRLVAVNTVGGAVGAVAAGFVLLPALGAWRSLLTIAAVYAALAATTAVVTRHAPTSPAPRTRATAVRIAVPATAAVVLGGAVLAGPTALTVVELRDGQRLVSVREGAQATVSVVDDRAARLLRVDNLYTLGSTRSLDAERNQSTVPLLALHPDPRSVFYLGLGTGITAGAGLGFDLDRVVVCELLDDVVAAADRHFGRWTNGLFTDPRAEVRAADGRACLRRSEERFDLVIADLFNPWDAGTGDLYTLEHYRTAQRRLEPGGAYVQWVALYQVTDDEFGTIANTMDTVFDEVTVWRGDLYPQRSIVALVGRDDPEPFDPTVPVRQGRQLADEDLPDRFFEALSLRTYVGNLTASGRYADRPINTDRDPVIEYGAPINQRAVRAGEATFLTGATREELYAGLREDVPYARDPYLAQLDERQLGYVEAGRSYSVFRHLDGIGRTAEARPWLDDALDRSPPEARAPGDLSPAERLPPHR